MPGNIPARKLGTEIKVARVRAGLTQSQLAGRVHVSSDKISRFELGRTLPDFLTLCALAKACNCNLEDLGISNEPRTQN